MHTFATAKGQIVIPTAVCRRLGITKGTRVQVHVDEKAKRIILTAITREYIHRLRGRYKGRGLMKALMEDKIHEREL